MTTGVTIDRDRLVETASRMVGTWSYTGHEQAMAELMAELYEDAGLRCQWQQVEDGRANALGVLAGRGRREEPHVQRAHGHVVLRQGAVAPGRAGVPARGVRP